MRKQIFHRIACLVLGLTVVVVSGCGPSSPGVSNEPESTVETTRPPIPTTPSAPSATGEKDPALDHSQCTAKFNNLFQDGAVLQQGQAVPIWGTGTDGRRITVYYRDQIKETVVKDGAWSVTLDPMVGAYDPNNLLLCVDGDCQVTTVSNVTVGEVWLCSGQSNMEMKVRNILEWDEKNQAAYDEIQPNGNIHAYTAIMSSGAKKAEESRGKWYTMDEQKWLDRVSAVAFCVADRLQKTLDVPVGIIVSAVGGSIIEQWIDPDALEPYASVQGVDTSLSNYYNKMTYPIAPYGIKGMLWYQGESNAGSKHQVRRYPALFKIFAEQTRRDFGNPDLPIFTMQLPSWGSAMTQMWAEMRFAQEDIAKTIDNVYMTVSMDHGHRQSIHPTDKRPICDRMGDQILNKLYGKDTPGNAPEFASLKTEGTTATVSFNYIDQGLMLTSGEKIENVVACGSDNVFYYADAVIGPDGKTMVVTAPDGVDTITGVSYLRINYADVALYEKNGLPVAPFCTPRYVESAFTLTD